MARSGAGLSGGRGGSGITRGASRGFISETLGGGPGGRMDFGIGLRTMANNVDRAKRNFLWGLGLMLVREVKLTLSTPGHGRVYVRGKRARKRFVAAGKRLRVRKTGKFTTPRRPGVHVASAPGAPPAPDTGALRNSINLAIEDFRGSVRVGTGKEYAEPLELGTDTAGKSHRVRIAPRPFMQPTLERVRPRLNGLAISTLQRATRGGRP